MGNNTIDRSDAPLHPTTPIPVAWRFRTNRDGSQWHWQAGPECPHDADAAGWIFEPLYGAAGVGVGERAAIRKSALEEAAALAERVSVPSVEEGGIGPTVAVLSYRKAIRDLIDQKPETTNG